MSSHLSVVLDKVRNAFASRRGALRKAQRRAFSRPFLESLEDRCLLASDLAITKVATPTPVIPGAAVTYTIVATNTGPDVATATIADTFPAGVTGVAFTSTATLGATGNTVAGAGNINNTVTLPVGSTITYTAVGTVSPTATGSLANTATITATGTTTDANLANNTALVTSTLTPQADLQISKTNAVSTVAAGQTTYVIVVSNAGPSAVTGATVTDTFTGALSGANVISAVGTGGASGFTTGVGNLNQIVNLPVGATITYTVTGTVTGAAGTQVVNTATVAPPAGVIDLTPATVTDTDVIGTTALTTDLQITKTDAATTTTAGGNVTYTIVVTNAGATTVSGATVVDTFPASLTNPTFTVVASPGVVGAVGGTGNINQTLTTLPAGATVTYTVTGQLAANATGSLSNTATVNAPVGTVDTNPANNIAIDTTTILAAGPDLSVTKTDDLGGVAVAGDTITYTIVVTNTGTAAAAGVTVTDVLPANTTFVSATQVGAPFVLTTPVVGSTGTFTATAATLAPGATTTFTIAVLVDDTVVAGDTISNTATVLTTTLEPNQVNNVATVDVVVDGGLGLVCEVFTGNLPGVPGTVELVDDADGLGGAIIVTGTSRSEAIVVIPLSNNRLRVLINGKNRGTFDRSEVQHIVVFAGAGHDTVVINATLTIAATLFGEAGNDTIVGARGADGIDGGDGRDVLIGGAGDDTICGGNGNDVIHGQGGNDIVGGDAGNDVVFGDAGNDLVLGGDGNDKVFGGTGNDQVFGQAGNDLAFGESGNDTVVGGDGNDKVFGGSGRDVVIGGAGSDQLFGEAHDDILISGSTAFDEDPDALFALLSDWNSSASFAVRVNNLTTGGGTSGLILDDSSVFDDDVVDTLFGGGGLDLFIIDSRDRVRDRARGEQVL